MSILHHIGRSQIAEVDPDVVGGDSSDTTHVIHDVQLDLPAFLVGPPRSYIATYPKVLVGSGTAKEPFRCPLLLYDNLHEEMWRAGSLAMPITNRNCNLLFLLVTQFPVWDRTNIRWHSLLLLYRSTSQLGSSRYPHNINRPEVNLLDDGIVAPLVSVAGNEIDQEVRSGAAYMIGAMIIACGSAWIWPHFLTHEWPGDSSHRGL